MDAVCLDSLTEACRSLTERRDERAFHRIDTLMCCALTSDCSFRQYCLKRLVSAVQEYEGTPIH